MVSDRFVFFVVPSNPLQRSALSRGTIKFLMPHILLLLLLLRLALWLWAKLSVLDLENFFNLDSGRIAKGVSSLQSSALAPRLSGCMWATHAQHLGSPCPSARKSPVQVLVLVQYKTRYNTLDEEQHVKAHAALDS